MENIFTRVLIKNEMNSILVLQDREDIWNFPGGKLELGESPKECAIREVEEETGIRVLHLTELFHKDLIFDGIPWMGYFYVADLVSGVPIMNEPNKIKEMRFLNSLDLVKFPTELIPINTLLLENPLLHMSSTVWN